MLTFGSWSFVRDHVGEGESLIHAGLAKLYQNLAVSVQNPKDGGAANVLEDYAAKAKEASEK